MSFSLLHRGLRSRQMPPVSTKLGFAVRSQSFSLFLHSTASGYDGPWTPTPTTFNNAYFTILSNLKWVPKEWDGPFQYYVLTFCLRHCVDAPTGKLMMLPTDLVLLEDEKFLKWVNVYAKDGDKFKKDFTLAFQKLEELGTSKLTPTEWA